MEEAQRISGELIKRKVAGWVNIQPVTSVYRQDNAVQMRDGAALVIKTIESKVQNVEDTVRELHGAKIPCVAAFTLYRLNREYKDWLINIVA
jgi:uncharacterized protein involved in tolerance to divalent cations